MRTVVDLVGKRFGRLLVVNQMKIDKIKMCECLCDCGNIIIARESAEIEYYGYTKK